MMILDFKIKVGDMKVDAPGLLQCHLQPRSGKDLSNAEKPFIQAPIGVSA